MYLYDSDTVLFSEMLLILFTTIVVAILTYYYLKPLIDNLFYSVPHEPIYIHSYIPVVGFGLEMLRDPVKFTRSLYLKYGKAFVIYLASTRWVYLYDEQIYLTKVLKSPDLSIDEFLADLSVQGLSIRRESVSNEEVRQTQLKQLHEYLVGEELEILNKRVHDSLIDSMTLDARIIKDNQSKTVNFFDYFGELNVICWHRRFIWTFLCH